MRSVSLFLFSSPFFVFRPRPPGDAQTPARTPQTDPCPPPPPPFSAGLGKKIDGWMSHVHTWAANKLTLHQHARGIYGAVGELGVWQGKLFIGMAGFSHPDEPLLAADWFTDDTDAGYLKGFVDNVRDYLGAATLAKTLIFQGNTMGLTPKWFADHKLPLFRMVSIDAGHSQECVLRDLNLIGW